MRSDGFSLVEMLLVIVTIGVLAVIAMPHLIVYRGRAIDAELQSDLRNAAVAVESYFIQHSVYPQSADAIRTQGFQPSEGVTLTLSPTTPNNYQITAAKAGSTQPSFTYTTGH